ncbi:hypothetical protein KL932_004114 [Ogataea haglerorum]|nr:hypothetical protein KL932_004114 [Ogataea haglerorum]
MSDTLIIKSISSHDVSLKEWIQVQEKTFLRWINSKLQSHNHAPLLSLSDLGSGVDLYHLLKCLDPDFDLLPIYQRPNLKFQKMENVSRILDYLKHRQGLQIHNIGAEDIVDGNSKLTLGLIWLLLLNYTVFDSSDEADAFSKKELLLRWCKKVTSSPAGLPARRENDKPGQTGAGHGGGRVRGDLAAAGPGKRRLRETGREEHRRVRESVLRPLQQGARERRCRHQDATRDVSRRGDRDHRAQNRVSREPGAADREHAGDAGRDAAAGRRRGGEAGDSEDVQGWQEAALPGAVLEAGVDAQQDQLDAGGVPLEPAVGAAGPRVAGRAGAAQEGCCAGAGAEQRRGCAAGAAERGLFPQAAPPQPRRERGA